MKNEEIIIEVKTKWVKNDNGYVRNVINYNCLPKEELKHPSYAIHFINEIKNFQEFSLEIDKNEYEIYAKNAITNEKITKTNEYIDTLLNYTKYQWNIEE